VNCERAAMFSAEPISAGARLIPSCENYHLLSSGRRWRYFLARTCAFCGASNHICINPSEVVACVWSFRRRSFYRTAPPVIDDETYCRFGA